MKHVTAVSRTYSLPLKADHEFEFFRMMIELFRAILENIGLIVSILADWVNILR